VLLVVEPDAQDVRGDHRREGLAGLDDTVGDAEVAVDIAADFASGAVGLDRGVGRAAGGEVAEDAHGREGS
jgi:hypothetical protein